MNGGQWWVAVGLVGEAQFGARFLLQWIASERAKQSIVPRTFWVLSVTAGITMLSYAIYRVDPIFIVGEAFGLLVFVRNLRLGRRRGPPAAQDPARESGPISTP